MKRILFPFRHSLQELNIKRMSFWGSSFSSFLDYFIKHPVNSVSFEEIWEIRSGEKHKVNNHMEIYREVVRGQVGENAKAWAQIKLLRNT